MTDIRDLIKSPWTIAGAVFSAVATSLAYADGVWSVIASTADLWFPVVAVGGTTIAESVTWIPTSLGQQALLAAAVVYVAILISRLGRRVRGRFGE